MRQQHGAALIVVLSLLSITLLLGLSGFQSAMLNERLAGNFRAASEAQMAAETAAASAWEAGGDAVSPADFHSEPQLAELKGQDWARFSTTEGVSENACSGNKACHFLLLREGGDFFIAAKGAVIVAGEVIATSQLVTLEVEFGMGPNPVFTRGLLSSDYIWVTGQSTVSGNVHSNGVVDIALREESEASVSQGADGMVEVPLPGTRPADEDMGQCTRLEPPPHCFKRYDDTIFDEYEKRDDAIQSCTVSIDALRDGDTVYCSSDLTVAGGSVDERRVTLVARGNIVMNGATSSAGRESQIGLFVVAGQDIEFNGSTDNFGVFWSGGYIRQNGNSSLYGAAVSGTYIRSNGGINFISMDTVTNPDTFVPMNPRLIAWK
jgi:hypothetical protein